MLLMPAADADCGRVAMIEASARKALAATTANAILIARNFFVLCFIKIYSLSLQ